MVIDQTVPGSQCFATLAPALQHAWRVAMTTIKHSGAASAVVPVLQRAWKGMSAVLFL